MGENVKDHNDHKTLPALVPDGHRNAHISTGARRPTHNLPTMTFSHSFS